MKFDIPSRFEALGKFPPVEDVSRALVNVKNDLFAHQTPLRLYEVFPTMCGLIVSLEQTAEDVQRTYTNVLTGWIRLPMNFSETSSDREEMWCCLKMYVFLLSEWLNRVSDLNKKLVSSTIQKLLAYDIFQLLHQRKPEEQYIVRIMNLAFPLLRLGESARGVINWLSEHKTEGLWEQWSARLIQLITSSGKRPETMIAGVKELVAVNDSIAKYVLKEVVSAAMRSVVTKGDSDAFRALGKLLEEVSEACPKVFLSELGQPTYLLDCESYLVRNGVVAGIRACIQYLQSEKCDTEPMTKNERLQYLFDILEGRSLDKITFSRQKVLDAFYDLAQRDLLPLERFLKVLELAKERLRDKASIVRKSAGKLVFVLLGRRLEEEQRLQSIEEIQADRQSLQAQLAFLDSTDPSEDHQNQKNRLKMQIEIKEFSLKRIVLFGECACRLIQLLDSVHSSDSKIAIEVLFFMQHAGIAEAQRATQTILPHIWRSDEDIKKDIMNGFHGLFTNRELRRVEDGLAQLTDLFNSLLPGERSSLEEVLKAVWENKLLDLSYFRVLQGEFYRTPSAALACFLRCASASQSEFYLSHFDKMTKFALRQVQQLGILEEFLVAAAILGKHGDKTEVFLLSAIKVLTDPNLPFQYAWFGCAGQLIKTVMKLSGAPMEIMQRVLTILMKRIMGTGYREEDLAKCLFVAGEAALKVAILIEKTKAKIQEISGAKKSAEQEMEQISSVHDVELNTHLDELFAIQNTYLLQTNLLRYFPPLIHQCLDRVQALHPLTQMATYLTMGKLMCISQSTCEEFLASFLQAISVKSFPTSLQCNLIVIFGDLIQRFPNILEDHINLLFLQLRDAAQEIRIKAMLIITHLVLNEMIKLREQAADILLMLVDENPTIRNLASLFLVKLKERHPHMLQNAVPEALSKLSDNAALHNDQFENIANRVIDQATNIKEQQSLIERLCQKLFPKEGLPKKRLCYCLAKCTKSEAAIRRLLDNLTTWQPFVLADEETRKWFEAALAAVMRTKDKDSTAVLDEFATRLNIAVRELPHKTPATRGKKPS